MSVEFDTEKMEKALRAALIIAQQTEVMNEVIGDVASDFGVSKGIAKKLVTAYANDKLEKTQEKMEDERSSLSNAEVMIEAIENMSIEADEEELSEAE